MTAHAAVGFPVIDPVGPARAGLDIPRLDIVESLVAPGAADADARGVSRTTLDALAAAGLFGAPLEPPPVQRELAELLAGCDASTWFCWVQHQSPLRTLEGAVAGLLEPAPESLRHDLLPGMRSGALVSAVAFAHVRRPGPPNPIARRVPGGWRLDGRLDWVTSWDVADVVMVMAQGAGESVGRLVCAFLPAGNGAVPRPGVVPGDRLPLLAMAGTHTRPVTLVDVFVPDDRIGAVVDRHAWLASDEVRSADANPSAFGLVRAAVADLALLAAERSDAGLADLAHALTAECRSARAQAYALADKEAPVAERLTARARALDLAVRAATAVVVARAGAAMITGCSAERRVREAMFLQVQAQTAASRDAAVRLAISRSSASAVGADDDGR